MCINLKNCNAGTKVKWRCPKTRYTSPLFSLNKANHKEGARRLPKLLHWGYCTLITLVHFAECEHLPNFQVAKVQKKMSRPKVSP